MKHELNEKENYIMKRLQDLDVPSLRDVAKELKISRQRVHQLKNRALQKERARLVMLGVTETLGVHASELDEYLNMKERGDDHE